MGAWRTRSFWMAEGRAEGFEEVGVAVVVRISVIIVAVSK